MVGPRATVLLYVVAIAAKLTSGSVGSVPKNNKHA